MKLMLIVISAWVLLNALIVAFLGNGSTTFSINETIEKDEENDE